MFFCTMDKEIPVKEFIREMMDMQAKAYRTVVEMLVNDVKSELRLLKNGVSDIFFLFNLFNVGYINNTINSTWC